MIRMKEEYYKPIEKDLRYYFYKFYWEDIFEALKDPYYKLNANNALIDAIRKGTIRYSNGVFSGSFTMRTSKELEKFAKYDGRSKIWKGFPSPQVSAVATIANDKAKSLNEKISNLIDGIPDRIAAAIDSLKYSIDTPLFAINKQADKDIQSLGISIDVTPELSERIKKEYTNNQNINIKNWTPEETERLREMIQKNVLSGYNRGELIELISSEYEVSMNKARFLARNETSLLMSSVRNERYIDAGINWYKWSNSGDIKVVGNPGGLYPKGTKGHGDHWIMQGKICKLNDPTVYADNLEEAKKGIWKSKVSIGADNYHPGQAYNDRCVAIPII